MNYFSELIKKAYTVRDSEDTEPLVKEFAEALINLNIEYKILSEEYEELKWRMEGLEK